MIECEFVLAIDLVLVAKTLVQKLIIKLVTEFPWSLIVTEITTNFVRSLNNYYEYY